MMLQYPDRPRNERDKLQARLEWLKANQPNNLEAIAALERRLQARGAMETQPERGRVIPVPLVEAKRVIPDVIATSEQGPQSTLGSSPSEPAFYERLKALHAKTGQTVYQCCVKLGLKGGYDREPMSEAERMVCRLTREGKIVWQGSLPIFQ